MFDEDYLEEDLNEEEEEETRVPYCKPTGKVTLKDADIMTYRHYEVLDLSEAEFGVEVERWEQILGYRCNFCAVIGRTGYRKVEVLKRLLEEVVARKIILPDDVCRRHINVILRNPDIHFVEVGPGCKLFSMKGDALMNKKGTKLIYQPAEGSQKNPQSA